MLPDVPDAPAWYVRHRQHMADQQCMTSLRVERDQSRAQAARLRATLEMCRGVLMGNGYGHDSIIMTEIREALAP